MIQSKRALIWGDEDENESRESRDGVDQYLNLSIEPCLKVFRLFTQMNQIFFFLNQFGLDFLLLAN